MPERLLLRGNGANGQEDTKGGVLLIAPNPQPEVRFNAENSADWEYKDEAKLLYRMAVTFRDRLVDPVLRLDRGQVPDPVISFEDMRNNNTLAAYTLARNPQGLMHEITFNTTHYEDKEGKREWKYGRWSQMETLVHEMLHLKQQKYGATPYKGGRVTHNKEFVEMGKAVGLNITPSYGSHFAVADERSPFAILMEELGFERPDDVPRSEDDKGRLSWFEIGKKEKGKSTLHKWGCPCGCNIRVGTKHFPGCTCNRCGGAYEPIFP